MSSKESDIQTVVITGMGTVNPVGLCVDDTWQRILRGTSGITCIAAFEPGLYGLRSKVAGQISTEDLPLLPANSMK